MYGWVWRRLPGPWPAKLAQALVLVAAVMVLLFTVVFPWLEPRLPFSNVTVDTTGAAVSAAAGAAAPYAPW